MYRYDAETMELSYQQGIMHSDDGSVMMWVVFTWNVLSLLIPINMSLVGDFYKIMHHVISSNLNYFEEHSGHT